MKPLFIILLIPQLIVSQVDTKKEIIDQEYQIDFCINSKNKTNFDPNKIYYWYKFQKIIVTQGFCLETPLNGLYLKFYPNKNLNEKGHFFYGLKNKSWIKWDENGKIISIENYKKGSKKGTQQYFENGTLIKVEKINCWRNKTIQMDSTFLFNKIFKKEKTYKTRRLNP
jgi:antitoxin component YwqK of YwqJK toxin-antitoxin module